MNIPNRTDKSDYFVFGLSILLLGGILAIHFTTPLYRVFPVTGYLTLHTILEFLSVVVSMAVFIVVWYNYRFTGNARELIICLTFLAVGVIDFAHTLSYNGMPDFFSGNSVNKASTYWILARIFQAAGILTANFVLP